MMYQKDTMSLNNTNCNESYHRFFNNKNNIVFNNFILFLIKIDEKDKKKEKKLGISKKKLSNRERLAHFLLNSNRNKTLNRGNEYE